MLNAVNFPSQNVHVSECIVNSAQQREKDPFLRLRNPVKSQPANNLTIEMYNLAYFRNGRLKEVWSSTTFSSFELSHCVHNR